MDSPKEMVVYIGIDTEGLALVQHVVRCPLWIESRPEAWEQLHTTL